MATLRERLTRAWTAWNLETRPDIFIVVTIFGAFVFSGLVAAFAAIGYFSLGGSLETNYAGIAICLPPSVVLLFWFAYRIHWFRLKFGMPR
jgi:hypothetical protein